MKCSVCEFDDKEKQKLESWERPVHFVEIEGHFTFVNGNLDRVEITLYTCPRCGTLKIDPELL